MIRRLSPPSPLARRLMRRSVDLLVVAFVITTGLSIGRQLVDWWRIDNAVSTPNPSSFGAVDFDWNRSAITMEFGDASTSIERIPFHGGRKELDERLAKIGQSIVNASEVPHSAIAEAEQGMLEALRTAPPLFWDSDRGNVYRRYEPMPSFIATRFPEPSPGPVPDEPDQPVQRIVGWGLAFPMSDVNWTIYVFHPEKGVGNSSGAQRSLALPTDSHNVTHLTGANGNYWRVFQGRGDLSSWVQHFDEQFDRKSKEVGHVDSETASLKYRQDGVMTDIQIRREQDGRLTGVVWSANEGEAR